MHERNHNRKSKIIMKKLKWVQHRWLAISSMAVALGLSAGNLTAQERRGRGDFNPEEFRTRMMERYREQLEVKSDDEWKVLEPRITKVMEARREVGGMGFGRGPGGPGGFGRRGEGDQGGERRREGGDDRRRMLGGEPNPDAEALQKAIESKASADEIKAKLAKYRESRKAKEANLTKAQDDLRKVLSVRQEASAVLMGLLQ